MAAAGERGGGSLERWQCGGCGASPFYRGFQPAEGFLMCPSLSHPQSSDNIPPGYEPISLLEALNGLRSVSPTIPSAPLYDEISYSGVVDGMLPAGRPLAGMDRAVESSHQKSKRSKSPDRSAWGWRGPCLLQARRGLRLWLWLVPSLVPQLMQNFRRPPSTNASERLGIPPLCSAPGDKLMSVKR